MSLQKEMRTLIVRHCETLRQESEVVADYVRRVCSEDGDLAAITAAEAIAHRIKGSSGSIGFPAVSMMAAALDDRLKALQSVDRTLSLSERQEIARCLQGLCGAIAAMRPESSTLYHRRS